MNIENKVDKLEKLVDVLKEELNILKTKVEQQEELTKKECETNSSDDSRLKFLYPGIF